MTDTRYDGEWLGYTFGREVMEQDTEKPAELVKTGLYNETSNV
jgi:hypothetical protein